MKAGNESYSRTMTACGWLRVTALELFGWVLDRGYLQGGKLLQADYCIAK